MRVKYGDHQQDDLGRYFGLFGVQEKQFVSVL